MVAERPLRRPIRLCVLAGSWLGVYPADALLPLLHGGELAGEAPRFIEWDGDGGSPLSFVLSRNLHRRHLDESQRSLIAVRAKMMFEKEAAERERATRFGNRSKNPSDRLADTQKPRISTGSANLHRPGPSNAKAGVALNVSARLVAVATRVLAAGDEQLVEAIRMGAVSVSDAATILGVRCTHVSKSLAAACGPNSVSWSFSITDAVNLPPHQPLDERHKRRAGDT